MCIRDRYEESVQVAEWWQRVKFSRGVVGGEERSSRMYWVEKCSTNNCFLNFCIVPVEIRRGFNVAVPSEWSERYLEKESVSYTHLDVYKRQVYTIKEIPE